MALFLNRPGGTMGSASAWEAECPQFKTLTRTQVCPWSRHLVLMLHVAAHCSASANGSNAEDKFSSTVQFSVHCTCIMTITIKILITIKALFWPAGWFCKGHVLLGRYVLLMVYYVFFKNQFLISHVGCLKECHWFLLSRVLFSRACVISRMCAA